MNYRLVSKVLGLLLLFLSMAMLLCFVFDLVSSRVLSGTSTAIKAFGISMLATIAGAGALLVAGVNAGREILRKEAIAIVGLGWLLCAVFGALPYIFCRPALSPTGAFFESMSGFTTTGATVIRNLDIYPASILLWRSLTQWLGGMGILVLFVAVLSYLGVGSKSLFRHESSAQAGAGFTRISQTANRLWQIYIGLSVLCFAGLRFLGMNSFDALTHTFTTLSTGGFSPHNESIAYFNNPWIEGWITLFMALSGISFMLYAWLLRGRWARWKAEEETKFYFLILVVAILAVGANLTTADSSMPLAEALRRSSFNVVSIMTTTGFCTADFDAWPTFSKTFLIILMFIGGCAGSTAGGMKVSRIILFLKIARQELTAAFRPTQVIPLSLNGNVASETLKPQTLFFIGVTGLVVAVGSFLVSLMEPSFDMVSSFSATVASLFNIGPGLEAVGPTGNYADLHPWTMAFLSLLMVLGRLELFAILVLFMPSLWKKY